MQDKVPFSYERFLRRDERRLSGVSLRAYLRGHKSTTMRLFWKFILFILLVLAIAGYFRYFWAFGTGVKAGELNYIVHKGVMFKTYEGKMVQTGIRSQNGTLQSYTFLFSVSDASVAERLMNNSGNQFNLHYTEYLAALPWRGNSAFVVDSIISMEEVHR